MERFQDFFHQLFRNTNEFYNGLNYWSTMFLFLFLALFFCGLLSSFLRLISVIIRKCGRCCSSCCKSRRSVTITEKYLEITILNLILYHSSRERQQKGYDHSQNTAKTLHEIDDPKSNQFMPVYRTPPRENRTKIIFEAVLILPQYHRESTEMERILPSAPTVDNMVTHNYDTRSINNSHSQDMDYVSGATQAYVYVPKSSIAYEDDSSLDALQNRTTTQMSSWSDRSPKYSYNKEYAV